MPSDAFRHPAPGDRTGDADHSELDQLGQLDQLDQQDDEWIARVDVVMAGASKTCGERWRCGPGRVHCCIGPFPIHQLDAHRLRRGLHELEQHDPERAAAVRQRVEAAVAVLAEDFPGDLATGVLDDDTEEDGELDRLCEELHDQPCPVLDPASGLCELYSRRPRVCRTFGPPLRLQHGDLPECPYCFASLRRGEREALRAEPDPAGEEDVLLERLEGLTGRRGLTLIALALRRAG